MRMRGPKVVKEGTSKSRIVGGGLSRCLGESLAKFTLVKSKRGCFRLKKATRTEGSSFFSDDVG